MEAQGGEVRRIHIVYFLSHMGHVEHPHLIRVQHFNRNNGVYLRDVKRWLADLRGKGMPEAFAWSYKRRYKTGYVWQDLVDDDLITPISDIEYVLKGSEIVSTSFDHHSHSENKASILKKKQQRPVEVHAEDQPRQRHSSKVASFEEHPESNTSTDFSSEINQESPLFGSDRSTLTNESIKLEAEMHQQGENLGNSSFSSTPPSKKNKMKSNKNEKADKASPSSSSFTKSNSSGASSMLRNLISCGAADTNDAALIMMNRADKNKSSFKPNIEAEIRKGERLRGSERIFGTTWNQQQQQENHQQKQQQQQQQQHNTRKSSYDGGEDSQKKQQSEFPKQKAISSTYKPMAWPNCSQCGKSFKPEKLHSHMKSCKGMKALVKPATVSTEKTPSQAKGSMASSNKESPYGYFLMNE
ncbi:hypothetical protein I3843_14G094700 [Carya illinoinensis]|nr:hypothetical protein I3843_14G094700 [Carya illinoinensis]